MIMTKEIYAIIMKKMVKVKNSDGNEFLQLFVQALVSN